MRTDSTLGINFFVRKKRNDPNIYDIYVRITVKKERAEISIKRDIPVCNWDKTRGKALPINRILEDLNAYLDTVYGEILNVHRELHMERTLITARSIKARYVGEDEVNHTLLELFEYHNSNMVNALKPGTMKNYFSTEKYLRGYISTRLKTSDVPLNDLKHKFILDFEHYIKTFKPKKNRKTCSNNGTMKHLERLMKVTRLGVRLEWLDKDPFRNFKLHFEKFDRNYLTQREIDLIDNTTFMNVGRERVKDIFLFSCYRGLTFMDIKLLTRDNISKGVDRNYWIYTKRIKTNKSVKIPMLPKAVEIMEKYENLPIENNSLLPVYSNQKTNAYLKEIVRVCGIHKNISFHVARHTFATTVTLSNGVPIETVSKMLGHTKLSTTQIYARVLQEKIGEDMQRVMEIYSKSPTNGLLRKSGDGVAMKN
ncbi:site-specific integrase [Ascidiimonas aurantiaca]|uniref:site-specific integrase n=1 Tax=Ascidiimonas aurantiaca TaxID=1685432 RepID=UPI0030EC0C3C